MTILKSEFADPEKFKSIFLGAYDNQHLIKNECHAMGRVLCNIKQVLTGMSRDSSCMTHLV